VNLQDFGTDTYPNPALHDVCDTTNNDERVMVNRFQVELTAMLIGDCQHIKEILKDKGNVYNLKTKLSPCFIKHHV
jgi:hypothetical protein